MERSMKIKVRRIAKKAQRRAVEESRRANATANRLAPQRSSTN
jgi:hypothetical protein